MKTIFIISILSFASLAFGQSEIHCSNADRSLTYGQSYLTSGPGGPVGGGSSLKYKQWSASGSLLSGPKLQLTEVQSIGVKVENNISYEVFSAKASGSISHDQQNEVFEEYVICESHNM